MKRKEIPLKTNIQKRRIFLNKTQKEVAKDLGFAISTYVLYERNKIYIRYNRLKKIADYFGVRISQLIEED